LTAGTYELRVPTGTWRVKVVGKSVAHGCTQAGRPRGSVHRQPWALKKKRCETEVPKNQPAPGTEDPTEVGPSFPHGLQKGTSAPHEKGKQKAVESMGADLDDRESYKETV